MHFLHFRSQNRTLAQIANDSEYGIKQDSLYGKIIPMRGRSRRASRPALDRTPAAKPRQISKIIGLCQPERTPKRATDSKNLNKVPVAEFGRKISNKLLVLKRLELFLIVR